MSEETTITGSNDSENSYLQKRYSS